MTMTDKSQAELTAIIKTVLEALPLEKDDEVIRLAMLFKLVQDAANMPAEGIYTAFLIYVRNHHNGAPALLLREIDTVLEYGPDYLTSHKVTTTPGNETLQ